MAKKSWLFVVVVVILVLGSALPSQALGARKQPLTLLVVPARYSVMQVGFDMAARYPVVLVSYQGDATTAEPLLHAWNGAEWTQISVSEYTSGGFMQILPQRVVLVGDQDMLPPALTSVSDWCSRIFNIASIDTATLVNSLGPLFHFRTADWQWFSSRFNLTLEDRNATRRQESWYDQPSFVHPRKRVLAEPAEAATPEALSPSDVPPAEIVTESDDAAVPPPEATAPAPAAEPETTPAPELTTPETAAGQPAGEPQADDAMPQLQAPAPEPVQVPAPVLAAPEGWQDKAVEPESPGGPSN